MVRVSNRLSIEDYVDFFQNPQKHYLNKEHLNQILSIHGYVKLDVPRADLVEELKTLTMESPFRSTLKEKNTSASVSLLNPEEIRNDLATIRWNEWSIDSAQIHRSGVEEERRYSMKFVESAEKSSKNKKKGLTDIANLPSAAAANLNSSNSKQQVQPKKKKVSPDSDTPAATTVQCLTDFPNLPPAANLNSSNSKQQVQPKKKKISPDSDTPAATTVQFLTDISNLPSAANLNSSLNWWSNSKQQVQAKKKKKVSPDSDTPAAANAQCLTDISNQPLATILNWSNSKQQVKAKKKKISPDMDMGGRRKKTENGALDLLSSSYSHLV